MSNIPDVSEFIGGQSVKMTLGRYIDSIRSKKVKSEAFPWYIYVRNDDQLFTIDKQIKSILSANGSYIPDLMKFAFEKLAPNDAYGIKWGVNDASAVHGLFSRRQWAVGVEGSGAAVHYHEYSWNAVVFGAQHWILYPPHDRILSNIHILKYINDSEIEKFHNSEKVRKLQCVLTAGDILMIPESWAHGALNIQETVAISYELAIKEWQVSDPSLPGSRFGLVR